MKKCLALHLSLFSLCLAEQKSIFVQVPPMRNWIADAPVIIDNEDGIARQMQDAGGNGWYSYSWSIENIPDEFFIYSAIDKLFQHPIGVRSYDSDGEQVPIMFKSLVESFPENDSFWYILDSACWNDKNDGGLYTIDMRGREVCYGNDYLADGSTVLYVLVPDYKEWIDETPVVVDSANHDYRKVMFPDKDSYAGWFYYKWEDDEWVPENLLIYAQSDSLLERPIGLNGFAYGETVLQSLSLGWRTLYFYPDMNYECEPQCCGEREIKRISRYDIRNYCSLQWHCLKDDFKPSYYFYFEPSAVVFSVYDRNDSLVVPEHQSVDSTEIVYTDGKTVVLGNKIPLADGDYVLKYSFYRYGTVVDGRFKFAVKNGERVDQSGVYATRNISQSNVLVSGRNLLISDKNHDEYAVFNPMGTIIARGMTEGTVSIPLFASGLYLVRIGGEIRRIFVK